MKSLLDIQKQIRMLEQTVEDVSSTLRNINDEIEQLCKADDQPNIDFKQIMNLSKKLPFAKHPLSKWDNEYACCCYIEVLLSMVLLDNGEEARLNRLVLIQWLLTEASINHTLEQLLTECYQLNKDSYAEKIDSIPKEYREFLLADALIIAYMNGEVNADICEYIVALCEAFYIDKNEFVLLCKTAFQALTQNVDCLLEGRKKAEIMALFLQYFDKPVREKVIEKLRSVVVEIPKHHVRYFDYKIKVQGQYVQKGAILAEMEDYYAGYRKKYSSPMDGACFCFQQDNVYYAVISHETDQLKDVQSWVIKRKKK